MGGDNSSPSGQVVSILKPAALGYLEIQSTLPKKDSEDSIKINIDRSSLDFDFLLSQKSYAIAINAVAALALNRPVFFEEGAICLSRRAADPPVFTEGESHFTKSAVLAIQSHVKSSCLTLLRNALSVQTNSSPILHKVLTEKCDMEVQADKALKMATQTNALKTAGRAARNRANMFYEWDTSQDQRTSKRQRETDDAIAKMRLAKAKRGLGHGIQLPTSMVDAMELVLGNLVHLPAKRPASTSSKRKVPATVDFVVDAIMTNGASLAQEEGRWYNRDGGDAWSMQEDGKYELSSKLIAIVSSDEGDRETKESKKTEGQGPKDQKKMFQNQCQIAASEAVGRIVLNSQKSRNPQLSELANDLAARLAWTLKEVAPPAQLKPAQDMALDAIQSAKKRIVETDKQEALDKLAASFPLVTSCLAVDATSTLNFSAEETQNVPSLRSSVINEAFAQKSFPSSSEGKDAAENNAWKYDSALDLFCGTILHASERSSDKPTDNDRKRVATDLAANLQKELSILPSVSSSGLNLVGAMCDIDEISKKAAEAARKTSQQTIAASAAFHAAKQAAEKRATTALLALRDAAFQRSNPDARRSAVR